jgi:GNAT superfamily N-acetyltransferase
MMEILKPSEKQIPAIIELAKRTWYATYSTLVPLAQIEYMLDVFYKEALLKEQMNDPKHHFLVLLENDALQGYSHCIELEAKVKLSKLYFAPEKQGQGMGKRLMGAIEDEARSLGYSLIELCVNRGNPAQYFYEKMGFIITEEADFPIGDYWMNDYVMQKVIF